MKPRDTQPIMNLPSELRVTVIMTVKNDAAGCAQTLQTLLTQSRRPDEIVVVDGGSTDGTVRMVRELASRHDNVRLIEAPGANIARGRNIATQAARHDIIASTDSGCRAEPDWLERLIAPFAQDRDTDFVAGFYDIEAHSLLERVVGLATMRGQLDPVAPATFKPSGRRAAYTTRLWSQAVGWPEWVNYSEDTLFDHRIRALGARWEFVGDAVVHWRPRTSLRKIAKQFYHYGTGRGHTQIDAPSFRYNLRNFAVAIATAIACLWTPWFLVPLALELSYFYVWTFHEKARRIMERSERRVAYPLALIVLWIVVVFNTLGYVVGTTQRRLRPEQYAEPLETYMANAAT